MLMSFAKKINDSFVESYRNKIVPWGPLGYVVYKRTYARRLEEGGTEEWWQTLKRCCNGLLEIGAAYTESEIQELYDIMFNLKGTVGGRYLWSLGTDTVRKIGADSLINCYYVSVNDPIEPFCFTFNQLMLGGGVGFGILPEQVFSIPPVKFNPKIQRVTQTSSTPFDVDHIVTDNREGWVKLLRIILEAYFYTGKDINYSTACVRDKGALINGFGGIASGAEDLVKGLDQICVILSSRFGQKLRPIDCLDIENIIGQIVVSGNVRRSAELSLGDARDYDYMMAKNWKAQQIPSWRSKSNNSVSADDFSKIGPEFWSGYNGDGEPYGLINLKNHRRYGRLSDGPNYRADPLVDGTNPCISGETPVLTKEFGHIRVDKLLGKKVTLKSANDTWKETTEKGFFLKGYKETLLMITENNRRIYATKDHQFYTDQGWKPFDECKNRLVMTVNGWEKVISAKLKAERIEAVYDCQVPGPQCYMANGILVHNCSEISLESYECCNLSEIYLPNLKSEREFKRVAQLLFMAQKAVTCMKYSHPKTQEVVSKNHRIGIGITGYLQSQFYQDASAFTNVYQNIEQFDIFYSKILGCKPSNKLTTVKPSGTLSKLPGVTAGAHAAYAPFQIRRIRFASDDAIVEACRKSGHHCEPEAKLDGTFNYDTTVVSFPVKWPPDTIFSSEQTAIEQLENLKFLQTYWADNSVSITVTYRPEELEGIKGWLKENYDDSVKSVSFLLYAGHNFKQAPEEPISPDQYYDMIENITNIEITVGKETSNLDNLECASGMCPVR
jgi:hypothetical protein